MKRMVFISFIVFTTKVQAQYNRFTGSIADTNFFQITHNYLLNYPGYGQDTSEGGNFMQFKRWQNFWGPRLAPTGSFKIAQQAINNYANTTSNSGNRTSSSSSSVNSNWLPLGPFGTPLNPSGVFGNGVGRINAIAFDPNFGTTNQIMYCGGSNSGVWKTDLSVSPQQWTSLNTDNQLALLGITSIAVDPLLSTSIYAATTSNDGVYSNGIYCSTDNGANWNTFNQGFPTNADGSLVFGFIVNKILIDPSSPSVMYAATSLGLFQCTNRQTGSYSWAQIYPSIGLSEFVYNVLFDPKDNTFNSLYSAGINIMKITNANSSNPILTNIANTSGAALDLTGSPNLSASPFTANNDYVMSMNIAISADGAFLYAAIITAQANYPPPYSFLVSKSNYFFQYTTNSSGTGTWSQKSNYYAANQVPQWGGVSPDRIAYQVSPNPAYNERVYTGGLSSVKTDDGGASWNSISGYPHDCAHDDKHAIEFPPNDPSGSTLFVGTDGGVWKFILDPSTGNVTICTELNNGLAVSTIDYLSSYESISDPYEILVGMQDDGINYLKGGTWQHVIGGDGFETAIDYNTPSVMYGTYNNGGGNGFLSASSSATTPVFGSAIQENTIYESSYNGAPLVLDPINPSIIYQGRLNIWKSTIGAATNSGSWTKISNFISQPAPLRIAIAPSDPKTIYVCFAYDSNNSNSFNAIVYKTTVGGCTTGVCMGTEWVDISPNTGNTTVPSGYQYHTGYALKGLAVSSTDPNHLWISFSGYESTGVDKVLESKDGGTSWKTIPWIYNSNQTVNLPNVPVNCIVYEKGTNDAVYIGTDLGVYFHDNTMNGWEPFMTGLPNVIVNWLEINYSANLIRAATYGRGVWESSLACPTIIDDLTESGTYSTDTYLYVQNNIASTATDAAPAYNVSYRAGNQIDLQNGFHASATSGTSFHAFIHGCNQVGNNSYRQSVQNQLSGSSSTGNEATNPLSINNTTTTMLATKLGTNIKLGIFPNPTSGMVYLNLSAQNAGALLVIITDVNGNQLMHNSFAANEGANSFKVDLSNLNSGVYFINITDENGVPIKNDKLVLMGQ